MLSDGLGQLDVETLLKLQSSLQREFNRKWQYRHTPEAVRRLLTGMKALQVPGPEDVPPGSKDHFYAERIRDGVAALQSLDDMGEETNLLAAGWLLQLQRKAEAWLDRIQGGSPYCDVCCRQKEADGTCAVCEAHARSRARA